MKFTKLLSVLFAMFFLSLAFVSASDSFSGLPGSIIIKQGTNSSTFTLSAANFSSATNVTLSASTINLNDGSTVTPTLTPSSITNLSTQSVTLKVLPDWSKMTFGNTYTGILTAQNPKNSSDNATSTITLEKTFCNQGNSVNATKYLEITSLTDSSSDKDWKWKPLDQVTVKAKVRFTNTQDSEDSVDIVVNLGLYDTVDKSFVALGDDDILEETTSLDEGKSATIEFTAKVPVDVNDGSGRYQLFVKAYEDGKENTMCTDVVASDEYSRAVTIEKNSYDVQIKNIQVTENVPCGQEVKVTADVYNLGTHDEDKIYVTLANKELGIDLRSNTFSINADYSDPYKLTFTFFVPTTASEKTYPLSMYSYFRYSSSSDAYRQQSDEFTTDLKVQGSCSSSANNGFSNITYVALSDQTPKAIIGSQLIIETTVKNTGSSTATFTVDVAGNSQWSKVATIDPKTFTLNAGESKKVNVYLDINSNAEVGEKEFTIKTASTEQKVKVTLEKGITSSAILNHFKTNWVIYAIILVNLILIIAIILVVKSIVSSKK